MRELFDKLLAEGEAGIDRLVAERTQESVTLDFKKKVDASNGRPDDQDKRVLAKAMSAFTNSAGGLIVYGVHGVPGADGVDCAQAARPIAEIERFISALHELTGELLQPRHSGIQVGMIRSGRTQGAGYAVVNVERSERRPHRSEAKDQKQYFKRGGSKSYVMEHYDIEDAFRRVTQPVLSLSIRRKSELVDGRTRMHILELLLNNEGDASAENVQIFLTEMVNCEMPVGAQGKRDHNGINIVPDGDNGMLNPGMSKTLSPVLVRSVAPVGPYIDATEKPQTIIRFKAVFGCRNVRINSARFVGAVENIAMQARPLWQEES